MQIVIWPVLQPESWELSRWVVLWPSVQGHVQHRRIFSCDISEVKVALKLDTVDLDIFIPKSGWDLSEKGSVNIHLNRALVWLLQATVRNFEWNNLVPTLVLLAHSKRLDLDLTEQMFDREQNPMIVCLDYFNQCWLFRYEESVSISASRS